MDGFKVNDLNLSLNEKKILNDISFFVPRGEHAFFTGESGSGKTSLLKSICGLIPDFDKGVLSGEIKFNNSSDFNSCAVLRDLYSQILGETAISEALFYGKNSSFFSYELFLKNCSFWGLQDKLKLKTSFFSAGELQKYLISCACAFEGPGVLAFDEAFSHLDFHSLNLIPRFLEKISGEGKILCYFSSKYNFQKLFNFRFFEISSGSVCPSFIKNLKENKFIKPKPVSESLICEKISFSYGDRKIISDFSCVFYKGCINGLYGPNGCGKTTFAKILASFLKGYEGKINVPGKVFLIPSFPYAALPGQTLYENARLFLGVQKAGEFLSKKGYKGYENCFVSYLGYSNAQKFITRLAMEISPCCIIIDEPLFDDDLFFNEISSYTEKGGCAIIISHDKEMIDCYCSHKEEMR
ncbi:MAG: ATP-binding cassette domain-containing protein [Elusimicrobiota bacterium]